VQQVRRGVTVGDHGIALSALWKCEQIVRLLTVIFGLEVFVT
jgi:hypothetical protein